MPNIYIYMYIYIYIYNINMPNNYTLSKTPLVFGHGCDLNQLLTTGNKFFIQITVTED